MGSTYGTQRKLLYGTSTWTETSDADAASGPETPYSLALGHRIWPLGPPSLQLLGEGQRHPSTAAAAPTTAEPAAPTHSTSTSQPRPAINFVDPDMAGNPDAFSSYARTAHSIFTALWQYNTDAEFTDFTDAPSLTSEHPVVRHLMHMNRATVSKVLHVLEQYSIADLQRCCPQSSASIITWSQDCVMFLKCCLRAHLTVMSQHDTLPSPAER